jgi:hypothetical protein
MREAGTNPESRDAADTSGNASDRPGPDRIPFGPLYLSTSPHLKARATMIEIMQHPIIGPRLTDARAANLGPTVP